MKKLKIGIVEDNQMFAEMLKWHLLDNNKYEIDLFPDAESFMKETKFYDIIITDYNLDDTGSLNKLNGGDLIQWLRKMNDEAIVLALTGQENVKTAIELMKLGVYDYLVKDENSLTNIADQILAIEKKLALKNKKNELIQHLTKDKRKLALWLTGLVVSFAASLSIYWWQNLLQ